VYYSLLALCNGLLAFTISLMEVTIPPVLTGPSLKAIRALRNISQAQLAELA
jgi:hypothetical protein